MIHGSMNWESINQHQAGFNEDFRFLTLLIWVYPSLSVTHCWGVTASKLDPCCIYCKLTARTRKKRTTLRTLSDWLRPLFLLTQTDPDSTYLQVYLNTTL